MFFSEFVSRGDPGPEDESYIGFVLGAPEESIRRHPTHYLKVTQRFLTVKANGARWAIGPQYMFHPQPIPRSLARPAQKFRLEYDPRDVRNLIGNEDYRGALFQVASNQNTLEFADKRLSMAQHKISHYPYDHTQGPAAQEATLPQLAARFFFAQQMPNLLAELGQYGVSVTESGWTDISNARTYPPTGAERLVGSLVVEKAGVPFLGYKDGFFYPAPDNKQWVSLVISAAHDLRSSRESAAKSMRWACVLLRGAYLNLFHAATRLKPKVIVMTLMGAGAFGNPIDMVVEAIQYALVHTDWSNYQPEKVVLNSYTHAVIPKLDALFVV